MDENTLVIHDYIQFIEHIQTFYINKLRNELTIYKHMFIALD